MNTRSMITGAGAAVLLIAAAVALKAAEHARLIPPIDSGRSFQVLIGLGLAFYANFIPKNLGAMRNPAAAGRRQSALRVAGWSFTVAGLAFAGLSAFAANPAGDLLATGVMASAIAITLIYAIACAISATPASPNSRG
jgi:hypothetical protein